MSDSFFSQDWYRVAHLKVKLKPNVHIVRHVYRDSVWYVIRDKLTGEHHRFNENAYHLFGRFDGRSTVQEIWERTVAHLGEHAPTQAEVVHLLCQLYHADVLVTDKSADNRAAFGLADEKRRRNWLAVLSSPLAIKVPLVDPDAFLTRWQFLFRPLFSRLGIILSCLVVLLGIILAGVHSEELSGNIRDRVLTPSNLLLLAILFPFIKILHELGHAFAVKVWGGEVHEIGMMFLVFMPVPYVDASAASYFVEKRKRILVGAAGMLVELLLAVAALAFWLVADEGVAKTLAYNVMLIAGISTVVFNANPLLRFDGYYMLADLVEIPNLNQRAGKYWEYLAKRFLMDDLAVISPATARGEAAWFVFYAAASWLYRVFVVFVIAVFVAKKYFFIGVLLALWSLYTMFAKPALKIIRYLFGLRSANWHLRGGWAVGGLAGVTLLILIAPLPHRTGAEGVVWLPEHYHLRAGADCFITGVHVKDREFVQPGREIITCADPFLANEILIKSARYLESEILYYDELQKHSLRSVMLRDQMENDRAELERAKEKADGLVVMSARAGEVYLPDFRDLPGRFIKKGELIGYIIAPDVTVRAVVGQSSIDYVRSDTRKVEFRRASAVADVRMAELAREIPAATEVLPHKALGIHGGGAHATDPADPEGLATFDKIFQIDIKPLGTIDHLLISERVYVRFHHSNRPLVSRWLDAARLFLMEEFDV